MNGVLTAIMIYGAYFGLGWLAHRTRVSARQLCDRELAGVFTTMALYGMVLCVIGPPFVGGHGRIALGLLLTVSVVAAWVANAGTAAAILVLLVPVQWFVEVVIEGICVCREDLHAEFPVLQAALFLGSLATVEWCFRRPRTCLPRAHVVRHPGWDDRP